MGIPVNVSLLDHFAALSDPRQHAKVLYPLPEILLLVLVATIAGADDFVETTLWGTEHLAFLRLLLSLREWHPEPRYAVRLVRRTGLGVLQNLLSQLDQRPARR